MNVITLTTDYGTNDWFVGTLRGVIAWINSQANVVDITHQIAAGDVRAGAFALMASYRFFPYQTIHIAVIDPGVGGSRAALLVQTSEYYFVGPDNGVLSWALRQEKIQAIHRLENEKFFLKPVSQTFHGRDIFAPVAAHLSKGTSLDRFGPQQEGLVRLPWPEVKRARREAQGEILYVDRFGNAITNLHEELLAGFERKRCRIAVRGKPVAAIHRSYEAAGPGKLAGIVSSSGFLELAINGASAARKFRLKVGDPITVRAS
jgi:S-adenosylmethionine hydrolase